MCFYHVEEISSFFALKCVQLNYFLLAFHLRFIFHSHRLSFHFTCEYFSHFRWVRSDKVQRSCTAVVVRIPILVGGQRLLLRCDILAGRRPNSWKIATILVIHVSKVFGILGTS